jgi:hypothetical protein
MTLSFTVTLALRYLRALSAFKCPLQNPQLQRGGSSGKRVDSIGRGILDGVTGLAPQVVKAAKGSRPSN